MDSVIFTIAVLLTISSYCFGDDPSSDKHSDEAIEKCMEEYSISESVINEIFQAGAIPELENVKCFIGCYWKKMGFINEDGEIDWAIIDEDNRDVYSKPEEIEKATEATAVCKEKVPKKAESDCETAYLALKCFIAEAKQRNLSLPEPSE